MPYERKLRQSKKAVLLAELEAGSEFVSGDGELRIRPSRSSRPSERRNDKGRARDDFERER